MGGGSAVDAPFGELDHPNWSHQIVDPQTGAGRDTSIAVDSRGIPHISYLNTNKHDLKYATLSGETWLFSTVVNENQRGSSTSIAIDSSDQPHIAYFAFNPIWNRIRPYTAYKQTEEWSFEERGGYGSIESEVYFTSIVIDDSDYCHFAYYSDSNSLLYYGYDYASGSQEYLCGQEGGKFTVLALDTNNKPHISFYGNGLKYYYLTPSSDPRNEIVVDDPNAGYYSSFALDQNGLPHFAYVDLSTGELMYVKDAGGAGERAWESEVVDVPGTHDGQRTCLVLDDSDLPHISYYDANMMALKYAWHDGTEWVIVEEAPSAGGDIGQYAALALDGSGNAHISHYDAVNQNLLYSKFTH